MTCSPISAAVRAGVLAALAAWPVAAGAQSQAAPPDEVPAPSLTEQLLDPDRTPLARSDGPRSLLPPARGMERAAPQMSAPAGPDTFFPSAGASAPPLDPAASLAARPGEEGTGIEVARLSGLADEGIGLIGPAEGGFAPAFWQGSRRLVIEDGLALLAAAPLSRSAADLYRRVLVSRGPLPQGASGGTPILALRLEALHAGGFAEDALRLARLVPAAELEASMAAPAARAALAAGETDAACTYLAQLPASGTGELARFSLELGALCQARAGMQVAALLSVDLAREQGASSDTFIALATRAAGGPRLDLPSDEIVTSLDYALAREGGHDLTADVLDRAEPALLVPLANGSMLAWPARIEAAERAAVRGLMSGAALADLYRRAAVEGVADAGARVAAFATVLDSPEPGARAAAVARAFEATPPALWPGLLPAFASTLRAVPPAMAHADHAVFMVEALAMLGDPVRAEAWIGIVTAAAPAETARLESLVRVATPPLSGFALPWDPAQALRAVEVRLEAGDTEAKWLTAFEMQAMAAVGNPVPQVIWAQFDDAEMPGRRLSEDNLRALRLAAEGRRTGEAVLAALNALLTPDAPGAPDPVIPAALTPRSLAAIVTALARGGLGAEARALATEALVVRARGGGA